MITIKEKQFDIFITASEIHDIVCRLASEISDDLRDKNPIVCPVLNGSFIFAADLVRELDFMPEISFVKYSSYQGTQSTGQVRELIGFPKSVKGRTVLIVEDIVETGVSMHSMLDKLREQEPAEIKVCTLMYKPECITRPVQLDYIGKNIPNSFIIGYGFDYDGIGRGYKDIYSLV